MLDYVASSAVPKKTVSLPSIPFFRESGGACGPPDVRGPHPSAHAPRLPSPSATSDCVLASSVCERGGGLGSRVVCGIDALHCEDLIPE